jgi:hypothetical protein
MPDLLRFMVWVALLTGVAIDAVFAGQAPVFVDLPFSLGVSPVGLGYAFHEQRPAAEFP